jgi:TM2 domain-containing membrane protein YozV
MKKIIFITILIFAKYANAETSMFEPLNVETDTNSPFFILHSSLENNDSTIQQLNSKDPIIAWLISFPGGMLGLHRVYLGTSTKTVILYIVTAGGVFGIVPMIDWILLLKGIQNGDISKYVNNRKFIMWL